MLLLLGQVGAAVLVLRDLSVPGRGQELHEEEDDQVHHLLVALLKVHALGRHVLVVLLLAVLADQAQRGLGAWLAQLVFGHGQRGGLLPLQVALLLDGHLAGQSSAPEAAQRPGRRRQSPHIVLPHGGGQRAHGVPGALPRLGLDPRAVPLPRTMPVVLLLLHRGLAGLLGLLL